MRRLRSIRGGLWLAAVFAALPNCAALASDPPEPPALTSSTARAPSGDAGLPAAVLAALSATQDFTFSYAQPGFYALLTHMRADPQFDPAVPATTTAPAPLSDWRALLERPADHRGQLVTIEGVLRHSTAWRHQQPQHAALGTLWELQVTRPDQPIVCKLILTEDAADIPLEATLRVTGVFIAIQHYYSETNQLRPAAVLIARGPSQVTTTGASPAAGAGDWSRTAGLLAAGIAGLTLVWLLLRRSAGRMHAGETPHATRAPAVSLAHELDAWAQSEAAATATKELEPPLPGGSSASPESRS